MATLGHVYLGRAQFGTALAPVILIHKSFDLFSVNIFVNNFYILDIPIYPSCLVLLRQTVALDIYRIVFQKVYSASRLYKTYRIRLGTIVFSRVYCCFHKAPLQNKIVNNTQGAIHIFRLSKQETTMEIV